MLANSVLDPSINEKLLDVQPHHYENGVPVFQPNYTEFEDFYLFQKSIDKYGMQSGIVKVIPPQEWLDQLNSLDLYNQQSLSEIKFRQPIDQVINNGSKKGYYSVDNIARKRGYNLKEWLAMSKTSKFTIPNKRGERINSKQEPKQEDQDQEPYSIDTSVYTEEKCEFLEEQYWKNVSFSNSFYAADSVGSLFKDSSVPWNVSNLPNYLNYLSQNLPGVNDAYLYGGLWKSAFTWHLEDQDLYSINYIHFGAPKQWYSIPQSDHKLFYKMASEIFPQDFKNCSEFLRHKTFIISPKFITQSGIKLNKIIHREKEFIITYPYGYHAGFNLGYNLAESVNFALDTWIPIGLKSKKCECISDAVGIDIESLQRTILEKQREALKKENSTMSTSPQSTISDKDITDTESAKSPQSTISNQSTIPENDNDNDYNNSQIPNNTPLSSPTIHHYDELENEKKRKINSDDANEEIKLEIASDGRYKQLKFIKMHPN